MTGKNEWKIQFNQKNHTYFLDGIRLTPVSKVIGTLFKPFDRAYWGNYKAEEKGVSVEAIYQEWREAANFGTRVHDYIDNTIKGKSNPEPLTEREQRYRIQAIKFLLQNIIEPIESEMIIGNIEHNIAGTIDLFCKLEGKYCIIDWKTNRTIEKRKFNNCLAFSYLADNNFTKYSFQQNLYRFILEKELDITIERVYLVHITRDNTELIECLDLRKEIKKVMDERWMDNEMGDLD